MFIKTIVKTDRKTGKRYDYYRLCEGYRIGDKVRHRTILSLGKLENISTKQDKKALADTIERLLHFENELFPFEISPQILNYAKEFSQKIIDEKLLDIVPPNEKNQSELKSDYQQVDINSIKHEDVREIGAEWLCKQAMDQLDIDSILIDKCGFSEKVANTAKTQIVSRAVYPASERKTADWIKHNSSVASLFNQPLDKIDRFKLYASSKNLYQKKEIIERCLSTKTNELFDLNDKIIFYDLTNTYFEGRKEGSKLAKFGRSKEKRSDAKLITLAAVVNSQGFLKSSKIYKGNISESLTLKNVIGNLSSETSTNKNKPTIVMDAGIMTEANTIMLNEGGYNYICVTRTKLKNYTTLSKEKDDVIVLDKNDNKINLKFVEKEGCSDTYMYVRSEQKAKKEASMNNHFSERYEEDIEIIKNALHKKGGTKKIEKVYERIGRLKERYPTANKHYKIEVIADQENKKAIDIKWTKNVIKPKSNEGVYFLRTNLEKQEEDTLWKIYNTLTEIEATFRVLKTDLSLRPVYHKTDENIEAHLFLGVIAYQIVATIRYQLKAKGIRHDWRNIVRIMNTQKEVTSTFKTNQGETIMIKKCSTPSVRTKEIYDALNYKHNPYFMKKSVVPE
jgi:hypothetical protein